MLPVLSPTIMPLFTLLFMSLSNDSSCKRDAASGSRPLESLFNKREPLPAKTTARCLGEKIVKTSAANNILLFKTQPEPICWTWSVEHVLAFQ